MQIARKQYIRTSRFQSSCAHVCLCDSKKGEFELKAGLIENALLLDFANPFVETPSQRFNVDYNQVDWDYLLQKSEENKVLLSLVRNLLTNSRGIPEATVRKLQVVFDESQRLFQQWVAVLHDTLNTFGENSHIDALLIKSLKGYPHVSVDLDFLLKNKESLLRAVRSLKQKGYVVYTADDRHKLCCMNNTGAWSTEIDLYSEVTWRNVDLTLFDYETMWNRRRITERDGVVIPTPSVEDDILITCAHSIFGHHSYFLGDLFYLASALKTEMDHDYLFDSARRFGYSCALYYFLSFSEILYQRFYNRSIIQRRIVDSFGKNSIRLLIDGSLAEQDKVPQFPQRYPIIIEFLTLIEKIRSNSNKRDLASLHGETLSLMIDNVHALMSRVYGFFKHKGARSVISSNSNEIGMTRT
jgi:hypothetical protein